MIYNHIVFIHIPRCGGTSVETFFDDITGHHQSYDWYLNKHAGWHIQPWFFTFIREPVERFLSLWNYWNNVSKAQWHGKANELQHIKDAQESNFKASVRNVDECLERIEWLRMQPWTDGHFRQQVSWLPSERMRSKVEIIPLARAADEWPRICGRALVKFSPLPKVNSSPSAKVDLTDNQKLRIREIFSADHTLWNQVTTERHQ